MTAMNGKKFTPNGKPYSNHNGDANTSRMTGKIEPTMLSIAFTTFIDVIVFLGVSIGIIIQVKC